MDNNYVLGPDGELYHHGTKGMKWGIRRYQNKDGSLTPAGKKRYAKLEAEMEKLGGKKSGSGDKTADSETPKAKSVGEMTDQEINDKINRMNLEKKYNDTVAANTPKPAEPAKSKDVNVDKPKPIDTTSKKKLSEMTDEEINARIERLNLEKSYKEAAAKQKTADMGRTKKFINKFIDSTVDKMAENVAADLVAQAIKVIMAKGINKALESKGFAPDVHTNNKRK